MNWKTLKQLNQLFTVGETSIDVIEIPLGKRILEMEFVTIATKKTILKTKLYDTYYKDTLLERFTTFKNLIDTYKLEGTNFDELELLSLVKIEIDKERILNTDSSQKEIATNYFNSAKYLKRGSKLFDAILKILEVTELPVDEHDQQFLHVLHCKTKAPRAIILCENDNQLRKPRLKEIELWFAGGRNTAKLKFITEPTIPFYYLCDWDNRGIEIYQDIKTNIFRSIEIIVPQEPIKFRTVDSKWKTQIDYSIFSNEAKQLLQKLIPDKWIEEESIQCDLFVR